MCGRLTLTHPNTALAALFDASLANDLPDSLRFNICPTQAVPVVTASSGIRHLAPMRWGLVPSWYKTPTDSPLILNARSDTVAEKPAFREAIRHRAVWFWHLGFMNGVRGQMVRGCRGISPVPMVPPIALGGLWQAWGDLVTCAVVTLHAGPNLEPIHDREPLILNHDQWPLWMGEAGHGAARLMQPTPAGALVAHRVGRAVNSNRADGPQLIEENAD